jgi:LysR family glycine cleavage system transcriptional activator
MQVQALEQHLGLPLFRRDGRSVEMTAEGVLMLPRVREGLGMLQSAIDDARVVRGSGALRISTLHSFLLQWLLPRLPDFEARHPKINLLVETSNIPVDFNRSSVQAAVRFGTGSWSGLHTEKILDEWLIPVCSPALLAKHGPVETQEDLKRYRLLHSASEPWSAWHTGSTAKVWTEDVWPEQGYGFDDSTAIVRSAEAGAGLALARWSLVAREVASGRLSVAASSATPYGKSYFFVCPTKLRTMSKVVAFRDWLLGQAALQAMPVSRAASSRLV